MSGSGFKIYTGKVPGATATKAHPRDPRTIRPVAGAPNQVADVAQLADAKANLRTGFISQHEARSDLANQRAAGFGIQNLPVQLTFTPFIYQFGAGTKLVVPHNPNRYSLLVSYRASTITAGMASYSFGPPISLAGVQLGIPLGTTGFRTDTYINQTCPIDDVWAVDIGTNNGQLLIYEGTIALDGNQL